MSKRRRTIINVALALILACLAQWMWTSRLNFLVWKITYIGERAAFLLTPPNYDSAASVQIFKAVAVLINALVYLTLLWGLHSLMDQWKSKGAAWKARAGLRRLNK